MVICYFFEFFFDFSCITKILVVNLQAKLKY